MKNPLSYISKILTSINFHSKNLSIEVKKHNEILKKINDNIDYANNRKFFSVVVAVYNTEKYISDLLFSLSKQSIGIENLEIIFVDDGSTDETAEIIKTWMKLYPNSIKYTYQSHSGQSVARNRGLEKVSNNWITFIDSDDFISFDYFYEIEKIIIKNPDIDIFSSRIIRYDERSREKKNTHPLDYKYENGTNINEIYGAENKFFQLSMSSTVFNRDLILTQKLKVKKFKPNGEDLYFVQEYILKNKLEKIIYIKEAEYFYRIRENNSSEINQSIKSSKRYVNNLKLYSDLIKLYKEAKNHIPDFVQNLIIYDLSWNIKELESSKTLLTKIEKESRENELKYIFKNIEFKNIENNWKYLWKLYQIGINNRYYENSNDSRCGAYHHYTLLDYDIIMLISIEDNWIIEIENESYVLEETEYREYRQELNGSYFITKYFLKLPKTDYKIYFKKKLISVKNKKEYKKKKITNYTNVIFFDRENKADDNAEIFYEYMTKYHTEYYNLKFCINKKSNDWIRLKKKGFKLIDFESEEFLKEYQKADMILSSSLDSKIENFENLRHSGKVMSRFIFLQHGITLDDQKKWFSFKKIDKVISTSKTETQILKNENILFDDQVISSGMPRFDKLYENSKNKITIMMTWRSAFQKMSNEDFQQTQYFKKIIQIINEPILKKRLESEKFLLQIVLHPEFNKFENLFEEFIGLTFETVDITKNSYRDIFATSKLLITDYSSVATDFAYLKKPLIYYQYDKEYFFKTHLYNSLFNYEKNGLGKVVIQKKDLINEIIKNFNNNFSLEKKYEDRINAFYIWSDKKNSQRLFNELFQ